MRVSSFGLESMSEPVGGADAEFDSFMRTALASPRAPHSAPDVLDAYEATRLVKTEHRIVDISASETEPLPDDKREKITDTNSMTTITREELSSTLSAIEERMDKRVERMELDSARRSDDLRREMRLRERSARRESIATKEALQAHIESNDKAVTSTLAALERTEKEFGTVKQANKEQRYWMAGIGVAIVLGIMGANATIFGGGKTFFDGGANSVVNQQQVEKLIQEAKAQSEANSTLLKQIQTQQESLVAPSPVKP